MKCNNDILKQRSGEALSVRRCFNMCFRQKQTVIPNKLGPSAVAGSEMSQVSDKRGVNTEVDTKACQIELGDN